MYLKTSKEFYHHIKVQWTERVPQEAVLKTFAIFTGKHLCWNLFLIKMQAFRGPALLKRDSNTGFFGNIEKCLRTPILKNNCERLPLRVSVELFPLWTNNIGSEEDVFSKIKQNKNRSKIQLYEKNFPFYDVLYHFVFLFFSSSRQATFALHNKRWY